MAVSEHEIVKPVDPLSVWYYVFHKNDAPIYIAPHWHRGIELSFLVNGEVDDFLIEKHHYTSHSGKILVVNTQEIHSIHVTKTGLSISIIFPFNYVSKLYPEIDHQYIDINQSEKFSNVQKLNYTKLQGILYEFISLSEDDSPQKSLKQQALVDQILLILLTYFTKERKSNDTIGKRKNYEIQRLQFITQYVNDHYQEDLSLTKIAKECSISKEYLSRFFKKQMDITVDQFISNVRAQHAHEDLLSKLKTLTEVAYDNGFSSVRSLNRAFKNLYGITASQFKHSREK